MKPAVEALIASVNFKVAVAIKQGVPVIEVISVLEKIAGDLEDKIEEQVRGKKND